MLNIVKKILGAVAIWLKLRKKDSNEVMTLPDTLVESKFEDTEPNMMSDSFSTTEHNSGDWPQSTRIYENSGSEEDSQRNDNKGVGGNDDSVSGKDTRSRSSVTHQDVAEPSSTRKCSSDANTSSKDLDNAVNRQKDFLRGFVKDL